MSIREAIEKMVNRVDLSEAETIDVMNQIMTGEASPLQVAAFLTALRMKGETVEEITGAARVMREKAHRVQRRRKNRARYLRHGRRSERHVQYIDDNGVGSGRRRHQRRQTWQSLGFQPVGQRRCLGRVRRQSRRAEGTCVEQCIAKIGIGFLFAPMLHEAMKYAVQPRRDIGIRTIFNILGPLTNPAMATHQLIGIYNGEMVAMIASRAQKSRQRASAGRPWFRGA